MQRNQIRMKRSDLKPGVVLHLTSRREVSLPFQPDGVAIVLSEAGKGKRKECGYNIFFKGKVTTFYAASTPTELILSAQINPDLPNIYYTFKPTLISGDPNE